MTDPRAQFSEFFGGTPGRSRRAVSCATRQPGWVARAAAVAMLVAVAAVVLLLLIPALLIGAAVFLGLSIYVAIRMRIARWRGGRAMTEGRENVRVIRRDEVG